MPLDRHRKLHRRATACPEFGVPHPWAWNHCDDISKSTPHHPRRRLMKARSIGLGVLLILALAIPVRSGDVKPVEFKNGVVVTVSEPGTEAGLAILKQGG